MDKSIIQHLRQYVGKDRKQVRNPCITANEAIVIANYIDELERRAAGKLPPVYHMCECGHRWQSAAMNEPCPRCEPSSVTAPAVQDGGVPVYEYKAEGFDDPDTEYMIYEKGTPFCVGTACSKEVAQAFCSTHPHNGEQGGEWVRCDERLPTEADGKMVWTHDEIRNSVELVSWAWVVGLWRNEKVSAWMPTGLTRPQPPKSKEGES